jgi:hypothetical protein
MVAADTGNWGMFISGGALPDRCTERG